MSENNINTILFDFDGTLVNSTPLVLRSFHATWETEFGFTFDDRTYINTFGMLIHTALGDLIERSAAEGKIERPRNLQQSVGEVLATYRKFNLEWHDQMIEPFDDISAVLEQLGGRSLRLGVVSSKIRAGVERGLDLFGLRKHFEIVIGAEDVTNHKPHPEPLLHAIDKFNSSPEKTIYIGDSVHDIAAGRAARVSTGAAAWGPFPRRDLEALNPDFLLDHPSDILSVLDDI